MPIELREKVPHEIEDSNFDPTIPIQELLSRLYVETERFDANLSAWLYDLRTFPDLHKKLFNPAGDHPKFEASIIISKIENSLLLTKTIGAVLSGFLELAKDHHPDLVRS